MSINKLTYCNLENNLNNIVVDGFIDNIPNPFIISFNYGFVITKNQTFLFFKTFDQYNYLILSIDTMTLKNLTFENNIWIIKNNYNINENLCYYNKKIIIFIRHGESITNKTEDYSIFNPELSEQGYHQSNILSSKLINFNNFLQSQYLYFKGIELAIISPLKRTLLTSIPTITMLPNIKVNSSFLCTELAGSPPEQGFLTIDQFQKYNKSVINININIDVNEYNKWSQLIWDSGRSDDTLIYDRVRLFDDYLKSREEKVIIVFSHFQFIQSYFNYILKDNFNVSLQNTQFIPIYHD
jgi:broad specificity phosphatase PhoE